MLATSNLKQIAHANGKLKHADTILLFKAHNKFPVLKKKSNYE